MESKCLNSEHGHVFLVTKLLSALSHQRLKLLILFIRNSQKEDSVFRDGVCESQFKVLNIELEHIIETCKFLDERWSPNFTLIIEQKNPHKKFFQCKMLPP